MLRLCVTAAAAAGALLAAAPALRADEAAQALVLATYKLQGDGSTATGLAIEHGGALYLVTAEHVFAQMKGRRFTLVSRTENDDGTYGRDEIKVALRGDGGEALWEKHPREDLALLKLPDSVAVGALPSTCLATEEAIAGGVHVGDAVRAAVFPEQSEANGAGFPLLRGGSIASFPLAPVRPHPMFLVHTTTWPGDSGGPVMHAARRAPGGGPLVIGLVRGMRSITDKEKASRYVRTESSYPLDIAEALHAALVWELLGD